MTYDKQMLQVRYKKINVGTGDRIKTIRSCRGVTQSELADKLGLTGQQISKYEKGQTIHFSKLILIAEILSVNPEIFVSDNLWNEWCNFLK
jgi:transcriptional regulator with XRE-family HTH domain